MPLMFVEKEENLFIKQAVIELINRNKGCINDIIEVINQMILIYTIINSIHNYKQIVLDLLTLKIQLQKELIKYENKKQKY